MLFEKNSKLLMIGDSITDCGRGYPVGEGVNLGGGYVSFVNALLTAKFPEKNIKVLNTGISGDTVRHLRARWKSDVLDLSPDYLSVKIGVNDVWRFFDSPDNPDLAVGIKEYEDTYRNLVAQAKTKIKKIILITPFLAVTDKTEPMMELLVLYIDIVKKIAAENDLLLVDLQPVIDGYIENGIAPECIAGDTVHPTPVGSMIIARAFLKICGAEV